MSELERGIKGINQKMLLERLKELQEFGLVNKKKYEGYQLHVEYFLSEKRGKEIMKSIDIMQKIGVDYINFIHKR